MNAPNFNKESFNQIVDIIIRLGFLFLIVAWCFSILTPFVGVLTWGIILALALHPLHSSLARRFKGCRVRAIFLGLLRHQAHVRD